MNVANTVLIALLLAGPLNAATWKPYADAQITTEQWQEYYDAVVAEFGDSRDEIAEARLILFTDELTSTFYSFTTHDHPAQQHYLNLYKLGEGPLYCFYTPYHLCHFEVPTTIAKAVLFNDATIAPLDGPCVDVVATAKIDLQAGEILDGIGYYMTYGQAERPDICQSERLLPMGLAEGARLKRDIAKDAVLTLDDVELPAGRLCDQLRAEQDAMFDYSKHKKAGAVG